MGDQLERPMSNENNPMFNRIAMIGLGDIGPLPRSLAGGGEGWILC